MELLILIYGVVVASLATRGVSQSRRRTRAPQALDDSPSRQIAARQAWLVATLPPPRARRRGLIPIGAGAAGQEAARVLLADRKAA